MASTWFPMKTPKRHACPDGFGENVKGKVAEARDRDINAGGQYHCPRPRIAAHGTPSAANRAPLPGFARYTLHAKRRSIATCRHAVNAAVARAVRAPNRPLPAVDLVL